MFKSNADTKFAPIKLVIAVNANGDVFALKSEGYADEYVLNNVDLSVLVDDLPDWEGKYIPGVWKYSGTVHINIIPAKTDEPQEAEVMYDGVFTRLLNNVHL